MSIINRIARAIGFGPGGPPPTGEQTGAQSLTGRMGVTSMPGSAMFGPMPWGTFETYRLMRANPTIALARAVAAAPILTSPWSFEADDDVADDRVAFVQDVVTPLADELVADSFRALDYGYQAFEKVWVVEGGRYVLRRLKALAPDWISPLMNPRTGALIGLRSNWSGSGSLPGSDLGRDKMVWMTYDGEYDDPFGRSRHENIRANAWKPWCDMAKRIDMFASKGAGIVPMVHYPVGSSLDATGAEKDNGEIAATLLMAIGRAHGVTVPNQIDKWAEDLLTRMQAGASVKELLAWRIEFLEAASGHGTEMLGTLKHYESLMLRGWLVPERSAIEGNFGTKAEAGEHGATGDAISDGVIRWMAREYNRQIVDHLLVLNYGPEARGTVRMVPGPVGDEDKAFFRDIFKAIFVQPANSDLLSTWTDVDAMLDAAGLPKAAEIVNPLLPAGGGGPVAGVGGPVEAPSDAAMAAAVMGRGAVCLPNGTALSVCSCYDGCDLGAEVLSLDCGSGDGGFKPGNSCGEGGGSGGSGGGGPDADLSPDLKVAAGNWRQQASKMSVPKLKRALETRQKFNTKTPNDVEKLATRILTEELAKRGK